MKKTLLTAAIALAGLAAFSSANAQSTYTPGDSLVFFYNSSTNAVIDVGNLNTTSFSSINLDLSSAAFMTAAFGSGWATTGGISQVKWGIIGGYIDGGSGNPILTAGLGSATGLYTSDMALGVSAVSNLYSSAQVNANQGTYTSGGKSYYTSYFSAANASSASTQDAAGWGVWSGPIAQGVTVGASFNIYNFNGTPDTDGTYFAPAVQTGTASLTSGALSINSLNAVPEPTTYALFGLGALVLIVAARRRNNA